MAQRVRPSRTAVEGRPRGSRQADDLLHRNAVSDETCRLPLVRGSAPNHRHVRHPAGTAAKPENRMIHRMRLTFRIAGLKLLNYCNLHFFVKIRLPNHGSDSVESVLQKKSRQES